MQRGDPGDVGQQQDQKNSGQTGGATVQQTGGATVQHYVLTSQLQALTNQGILPGLHGSTSASVQVVGGTAGVQQPAVIVVSTAPLSTSHTSTILSAQALQQQLTGQGVLGIVTADGQPFTISNVSQTGRGGELQIGQPITLGTTPSGATGSTGTGGTVHHHGQSPSPRGSGAFPHTNLQQSLLTMSNNQQSVQQKTTPVTAATSSVSSPAAAAVGRVLLEAKPSMSLGRSLTFPNLTALANQSSLGPSPKKKVKVEESLPASVEIASNRKLLLDHKYKEMLDLKENYIECLTELFFLQNGGNMMDYFLWKKRPTPQLVHFLKSGNLDSDEDDDQGLERKINNEVKVITCSGSNVPIATPVAISTTLPPSVAALNQQGCEVRRLGGRHGMVFGHVQPAICTQIVPTLTTTITNVEPRSTSPAPLSGASSQQKSITTSINSLSAPIVSQRTSVSSATMTTVTTTTSTSMSQLQSHLAKAITDTKPLSVHTSHKTAVSGANQLSTSSRTTKSPPVSPSRQHTRQHTISAVYDGTIGSQEAIVERAKQEAQCMQRVAELRKEGLWSTRRLPKVQEPSRNKSHWDYLLEEMQWLAADFSQERKWKKAAARKLAKMVSKHFQELEQKEVKAEKEEAQKLKKIASQIARQIREFWNSIEKVVQFKQTTRLEEKRKKALDIHLNFIVDQTEKYSTWLTEGLKQEGRAGSSVGGSVISTPEHSIDGGDNEFEPEGDDSDDEETIAKEEADSQQDDSATKDELAALQKEGEVPIEELLKSLPQEVLDKPASVKSDDSGSDEEEGKDKEFNASEEEEIDVEETIEEQEKHEKADHNNELKDLQDEGEMSMEELYKKYAAAYDSDFEMPESASESDSDDEEEEEDDEEESEDEDEDVDVEEENEMDVDKEDVGIEFLMHPEQEAEQSSKDDAKSQGDFDDKGPGKELTDIAAEAQSLQPKGYTLQTTEVKTAVPFLLKHKLREYQHVGLDWLATMYEKKLNGILADEMGLGKTIQTIALLAHLACVKGIWGPHLIVVPTSVMLNWEMEIKKWCPAFKILTYYGSQKERKLKRQGWTKTNAFHVCITSYKLVIQDHQSFRRKKWKYLILDEAQNIKNFKSQRWQTLLNFSSQRRLLLTGTPLQNSLMELWSLMHFLMPHVFQSHREFKEWFANPLTGMIEGSHEYNESLIRRLHKVLRPFLLRRLKDDVEKQMPKKYEHVIMCALSKRQRFLYDEFMSQTKTKETLAAGHFMSVINILMQLRKVCNHPSLFDPRPITSPFRTEPVIYKTASLALRVFDYDPFENIDVRSFFPSLADMELDLPAFIAHRVKKLQTNGKLIEEIHSETEQEERPKPGKLKSLVFRSVSPVSKSGKSSPVERITRSESPVQIKPVATSTVVSTTESAVVNKKVPSTAGTSLPVATLTPVQSVESTTVASATVTSSVQTVQATYQAKVLPQITGQMTTQASTSHVTTSQPITVQIQQTEQGARLMIPAGQLSQLPAGFIQIVQTSMGQQIIATSSPITTAGQQITSTLQNVTTPVAVVNGPPTITTMASSSVNTVVTSVTTQVRATPTIQLPSTTAVTAGLKPVMKVSPIATESTQAVNVSQMTSSTSVLAQESKPLTNTTMSVPSVRMSIGQSQKVTRKQSKKDAEKNQQKSELFLNSLCEKRRGRLKEKLDYLARLNKIHCERKPVYGEDLCHSVNIYKTMYETSSIPWTGEGYINCHNVHMCKNPYRPEYFWNRTQVLSDIVHTPEQYLQELYDILSRYTFVTPPVTAPPISMHISHPPPCFLTEERWNEYMIHKELSPLSSSLHMISTNMLVQFPELRLIQYDCGKLQTLDILLRRLKSGQHRVLIFTQMTRMLDILESFLNFHGHRYLRLDGATKVEQRQLLMDRFNADPRIFCFILSTRSGGLGVNLTGADTVVFYDSDWNPTMDAQAQDRCHRIGQTRDVHIYRLISEQTVEENILKKANQKRMLGDMAIEGGNFTTAFFKEQTIKELFTEPSGLDSLVKEKEEQEKEKESREIHKGGGDEMPAKKPAMPKVQSEINIMAQFEKALGKAEDENDVTAAAQAKAEQKAELAEFDEDIPWDEREAERKKEEEDMSRGEQELAMLEKELSPVERYAVAFMEFELEPLTEELEMAEEDVENAKKEWELGRLKALKEEEERRAEIEEDEMLFTFSREDAYNKVFKSDIDQENMPMWAPPTPPHDDNDIYIDQTFFFLYEPNIMPESQLPPVYIKKERKKPKIETITTRKQKQRKEEQPRVPRSLFDRPTSALLKMRREAKLKHGLLKPFRPVPQVVNKPAIDPAQDQPEWLIHEDWALLQAVQSLFDVPLNLMVISPAHQPNWDLVADVVNCCSRVYRSAKQCKYRYEYVVIPREEGRILYDMNPKKQSKKTKGIYKTKNNRPMRTSQLFVQDGNSAVTMLHSLRFDSCKGIASKRPPTLKQTLVNPTLKNPKHATVLSENGINYDTPLHPMQVAEIRAQRIQREKKQSQAAAQATAEQQLATQRLQQAQQQQTQQPQVQQTVQQVSSQPQTQQTTVSAAVAAAAVAQGVAQVAQPQLQPIGTAVTTTVMPAGTIAKSAVGQTVTAVSLSRAATVAGNIVLNTQGGVATNFAAINRRMSQATANIAQPATVTVTGTLNPAVRAQRTVTGTPLTIQEITAIGTQTPGQVAHIATGQVARTQIQTTVATTFTAGQLAVAQRITNPTTVSTAGTVQQQLTQPTAAKTLTPQQLLTLQQQQALLKQRALQQQQQQIRMQKLNLTADQIRQQQLKQIQGRTVAGQKVITQQLVTSIGGIVPKQTQVKAAATLPRQLTTEDLARLKQQQLAQKTQIPTTQIIQAQVQPLAQPASIATSGTTLVKTVSAPGGGVPIPVSTVNINVSLPQQKTGVAKQATVSHQIQQIQRMQLLKTQQQRLPTQQKITSIGQPVGKIQSIPLSTVQIIQQPGTSGQLVQQFMKRPNTGSFIMTSQPIIATVTQSQPPGQMVTKVLGTSATTTNVQTITPAATTVALPSASIVASPAQTAQSVATISVAAATVSVAKPATVATVTPEPVTTVQVQPISTATNQARIATLTQSAVVSQPIQQIQVTPTGTIQQVQTTTKVTPLQTAPTAVTVTVTPTTPATTPVAVVQQHVTPVQTVVQAGTVTTQEALAAAQALPQPPQPQVTIGNVTAVVQTQQLASKPAPYAMRTRNQPKH